MGSKAMEHLGPAATPTSPRTGTATATATETANEGITLVQDYTKSADEGSEPQTWEAAGEEVYETLQAYFTRWIESGNGPPGKSLAEAMAGAVYWFVSDLQKASERRSWELAAVTENLGQSFQAFVQSGNGVYVAATELTIPGHLADAVRKWLAAYPRFVNPPGEIVEKKVILETLTELRQQRVPDSQICRIFNWLDENGQPDILMLRRAKRGEIRVPTHQIVRYRPSWPSGPALLTKARDLKARIDEHRDLNASSEAPAPETEFVFADEGDPIPNVKGTEDGKSA